MPVQVWRDPAAAPADRVADLLGRMTVAEKVAQLSGVWLGADATAGEVAPHQRDAAPGPARWDALIGAGVGQLTRPFGSAPVDPARGAVMVARAQRRVMSAGRFGIPAMVHEECLTGLMAWQATIYPSPLCWGASFDPALVERMAAQIGATMRRLGVHQGLAPGPGCYARPALGPGRGDHRRGSVPGRHDRQCLRARPGVGGRRGDAARLDLAPGQATATTFTLHADLTSYTGRAGQRQVDPGEVELRIGASSADIRETVGLTLAGPRRLVGFGRVMQPEITTEPPG